MEMGIRRIDRGSENQYSNAIAAIQANRDAIRGNVGAW
jgi:hypothetical protein